MPVAVLGMHRSGTSLVAQMLAKAGLCLGRDEDLVPGGPDNPDGYWEHAGFHSVNERVLAELGGGWDSPPDVPARWRDDPRLRPIVPDARRLVAEFDGREPWGWKDPRTSITLPLWTDLIPDLKVVVCVRNPLEVAFSLNRRGMFSYSTALRLWRTYYDRILDASTNEQRLVTDYGAYFTRPKAELRRLLLFLDLDVPSGTLEQAAAAPDEYLRHTRFELSDLLEAQVAPDIVELYSWLRKQARPTTARPRASTPPPPAPDAPQRAVDAHAVEAEALRQQLAELRPWLDDREAIIAALREELADAGRREAALAGEIELLREQLGSRDRLSGQLNDLQESFYKLEAAIQTPPADERAAAYASQLRRIKEIVRRETPPGASVAVVTKGDDRLTGFYGRRGMHFPQTAGGAYAGGNPATALSAIAHLEVMRARGADYFLLPSGYLWFLEHYADLRRHLSTRYLQVAWESDACALFALRAPPDAPTRQRAEAVDVASAVRSSLGRSPTVLDWSTGLDLPTALPSVQVSGQSLNGRLPYPDESVDIVALASTSPSAADEAERVASAAVIRFPVGPGDGAGADVRIKVAESSLAIAGVSIVVVIGGDSRHVESALASLEETLPGRFAGQIVLVDEGSAEARRELLDWFASAQERTTIVPSTGGAGALESASRGAAAATEETLVFVDADLLFLPGWLRPLLDVLRERADAGAVGGRLLRPDGSLEEAGGTVFRDGSALRLGYGEVDPEAGLFDYVRPVDFCSRLLLATPRRLFLELGGFDRRLGSDVYGAIEYCLALRRRDKRVYFQPASNAVHLETPPPERRRERSRGMEEPADARFVRRWRSLLKQQPERPAVIDLNALHALASGQS